MKLVEIKNSLAKFYYKPVEFPLVISDFLTVNDGNKKILSQVVSIESTSKTDTNCAILKFSLDINEDNTFAAYSGYTPALDADVQKASENLLKSVFSGSSKAIYIGNLTNSSQMPLNTDSSVLEDFLYIQSDIFEETQNIFSKICQFNAAGTKKSLIIDFKNISDYPNACVAELGKEFKLPVDNDTLNYIYEYDLTGLTVEQKTIVQDIILEIQDYINTLESKFIPFDTLLEVVNDIYATDKSTGIILLRNKLLKYKQLNIFASKAEEVLYLDKCMSANSLTVLNLANTAVNWQKQAIEFVLNNTDMDFYLFASIDDNNITKEILNKIYKNKNIKPILASAYDCVFCAQLKSFAKNLILFKPNEQQKSYATYNSFLMKLAPKEFVLSGQATFYTPLIVKEFTDNVKLTETDTPAPVKSQKTPEIVNIMDETQILDNSIEIEPLVPTVEDEISKDVDQIFYAQPSPVEEVPALEDGDIQINYNDMFSDADLDLLDNINEEQQAVDNQQITESGTLDIGMPPLMVEDEALPALEEADTGFDAFNETEQTESSPQQQEILENITENASLPGIPIYKADENTQASDDKIQISEGNIVYHEKYGKGVVEELFNYGKRTLCSIQFDNVGRRLLDPNLADLKQM